MLLLLLLLFCSLFFAFPLLLAASFSSFFVFYVWSWGPVSGYFPWFAAALPPLVADPDPIHDAVSAPPGPSAPSAFSGLRPLNTHLPFFWISHTSTIFYVQFFDMPNTHVDIAKCARVKPTAHRYWGDQQYVLNAFSFKYALRVPPAVTRLTVYRRLRVDA